MKKYFVLFIICVGLANAAPGEYKHISYEIETSKRTEDVFVITVFPGHLTFQNTIYNFPVAVPGIYSICDFGKYVKSFEVFDEFGNELDYERISTNRFSLENAENVYKIIYEIEETWGNKLNTASVPMVGSSIHDDFVVINTAAMLGYFSGLESLPVQLKILNVENQKICTALNSGADGTYFAENYEQLIDAPILIGANSDTIVRVDDVIYGLCAYCKVDTLFANRLAVRVEEVANSVHKYFGYTPVANYKFQLIFLDIDTYRDLKLRGMGALEHRNNSLYVFATRVENIKSMKDVLTLERVMTHEYFHVLTPLNLHSSDIEPYDFNTLPKSKHLWLYEGVTEWSSEIALLRNNVIDLENFLNEFSGKLKLNDEYKQDISLVEMSTRIYEEDINNMFRNFYMRGAAVATLLDIRLLELSQGKMGLRDLILKLYSIFNYSKTFPEDDLFEIIVDLTYPEIEQFINDYLKDYKPLPVKEYFEKIGIDYKPFQVLDEEEKSFGFDYRLGRNGKCSIRTITQEAYQNGIRKNDRITELLGVQILDQNSLDEIEEKLRSSNSGELYTITIVRNDEENKLTGTISPKKEYHIFLVKDDLTDDQEFLKKCWLSYPELTTANN